MHLGKRGRLWANLCQPLRLRQRLDMNDQRIEIRPPLGLIDARNRIAAVGPRGEAIDALVAWAQPGDAVIVVGKGHEVGQLVGTQKLHFDDREEMRRALSERGAQA